MIAEHDWHSKPKQDESMYEQSDRYGLSKNRTLFQRKFLATVLVVQNTLDEFLHPGADCSTHPLCHHACNRIQVLLEAIEAKVVWHATISTLGWFDVLQAFGLTWRGEQHTSNMQEKGPSYVLIVGSQVASSCAPYKIQNTSEARNASQNTPRILSRNQNTEKIRKNYENPRFLYNFRTFFAFWFRGGWGFGVYFGVHFGAQRGFVFCRAHTNSQVCENPLRRAERLILAGLNIWAAAQIIYLNSCQSRFSGVYLVFDVFQDTWPSNKENPSVTGVLPCLAP